VVCSPVVWISAFNIIGADSYKPDKVRSWIFVGAGMEALAVEAIVMIKSISQDEMNQFLPHRPNIDRFIGVEIEWFSDDVGNIIGAIGEGTSNINWGYVVLRRDDCGKYRFWDLETGIESCDATRIQIVRAMETTQTSGQKCSPLVG
jgi:hypothetical protein